MITHTLNFNDNFKCVSLMWNSHKKLNNTRNGRFLLTENTIKLTTLQQHSLTFRKL